MLITQTAAQKLDCAGSRAVSCGPVVGTVVAVHQPVERRHCCRMHSMNANELPDASTGLWVVVVASNLQEYHGSCRASCEHLLKLLSQSRGCRRSLADCRCNNQCLSCTIARHQLLVCLSRGYKSRRCPWTGNKAWDFLHCLAVFCFGCV